MAPADVPEMATIFSRSSSSRRSSTPQVKAPCEPPPCSAKSMSCDGGSAGMGNTPSGKRVATSDHGGFANETVEAGHRDRNCDAEQEPFDAADIRPFVAPSHDDQHRAWRV